MGGKARDERSPVFGRKALATKKKMRNDENDASMFFVLLDTFYDLDLLTGSRCTGHCSVIAVVSFS